MELSPLRFTITKYPPLFFSLWDPVEADYLATTCGCSVIGCTNAIAPGGIRSPQSSPHYDTYLKIGMPPYGLQSIQLLFLLFYTDLDISVVDGVTGELLFLKYPHLPPPPHASLLFDHLGEASPDNLAFLSMLASDVTSLVYNDLALRGLDVRDGSYYSHVFTVYDTITPAIVFELARNQAAGPDPTKALKYYEEHYDEVYDVYRCYSNILQTASQLVQCHSDSSMQTFLESRSARHEDRQKFLRIANEAEESIAHLKRRLGILSRSLVQLNKQEKNQVPDTHEQHDIHHGLPLQALQAEYDALKAQLQSALDARSQQQQSAASDPAALVGDTNEQQDDGDDPYAPCHSRWLLNIAQWGSFVPAAMHSDVHSAHWLGMPSSHHHIQLIHRLLRVAQKQDGQIHQVVHLGPGQVPPSIPFEAFGGSVRLCETLHKRSIIAALTPPVYVQAQLAHMRCITAITPVSSCAVVERSTQHSDACCVESATLLQCPYVEPIATRPDNDLQHSHNPGNDHPCFTKEICPLGSLHHVSQYTRQFQHSFKDPQLTQSLPQSPPHVSYFTIEFDSAMSVIGSYSKSATPNENQLYDLRNLYM